MNTIGKIYKTLIDSQKKIFSDICYRFFLDMEKRCFKEIVIHFVLLQQIYLEDLVTKFWFRLNRVDVCLSLLEFAMVIGLRLSYHTDI